MLGHCSIALMPFLEEGEMKSAAGYCYICQSNLYGHIVVRAMLRQRAWLLGITQYQHVSSRSIIGFVFHFAVEKELLYSSRPSPSRNHMGDIPR